MVLPPGRLAETPNVQHLPAQHPGPHNWPLFSRSLFPTSPIGIPVVACNGVLCAGTTISFSETPQAVADRGEEKGLMGGTSGDVRERRLL